MPALRLRAFTIALLAGFLGPAAHAFIDRDGDGVNDLWAARHGGNLPPHADTDGDGVSNLAESIAGTDPRDPASRLYLRSLEHPAPGRARLRWPSVPAKLYRVQASTDLATWITLAPTALGDGSELSLELDLARSYAGGDFTIQRWENLPANTWLDSFKALVNAGNTPPTRTLARPALSIPQTSPDIDRFGQHARGWIVPPADGQYRFFIVGDDACEFQLSTSADPAALRRIAHVPGWTYPEEWTKHPEQTSALITLQAGRPYAFRLFHIDGTSLDHVTVAWTGPGLHPDKEPLAARYHATDPQPLSERIAAAGGRVFYRVTVEDIDSDGDGLSDHDELFLGTDPRDATTQPRVPDLEAALARLNSRDRLTLGSSSPRAYETGSLPATATIFRSGNLGPVTVRYTVSGTATPGVDYVALPGEITVPAGSSRIEFSLTPLPDALVEPPETVVITLLPDPAFDLGTPSQLTLTIDDAPDELYLAALRPPSGLASGAWGYAALRSAGNGLTSRVSLSYSALLGPAGGADLFISSSGASGPVVLGLAAGQVSSQTWDFAPAAGQSRETILAALREGRLWVRVRSAPAPDGELFGQLLPATGSEASPPPPPPAALPSTPPTLTEAHRFLEQAAFGASPAAVTTVRNQGYAAWLEAQRTQPITRLLPQVESRRAELLARSSGQNDGWQTPLQEAWWQSALTAPDQLRQRVAWALSQILVVSQEGALADQHEPVAAYYDLLLAHALGNYRDLLGDVTRSPVMGVYLSMIRNQRPDPETGQRPDENYARELMQLFTIGLNELHPDGTLRLDHGGLPVPTYTQADIVGLSHVFTGWGPHYDPANPPRWSNGTIATRAAWFQWGTDMSRPMSFYPEFHDLGAKRLVRGVTIPAGADGSAALDTALDALFQHPNLGPFLGRQLIQRLVTSNPSPAYVQRVAAVFANNGSQVRGDLFATVRAVLLDPEARLPAPHAAWSFGKRAEPVLRLTRLFHVFPPAPPRAGDPRFFLNYQYEMPHQVPLGSPSVFNFFQPVYAHPGRVATAGLLSPEFQVTSETTVINESNRFHDVLNWGKWTGEPSVPSTPGSPVLVLTVPLDAELAILARSGFTPAENYAALLTHLADKQRGGRLGATLRNELTAFHAALPSWYWTNGTTGEIRDRRLFVIRYTIHLIALSPETVIDR
jgi:uncharacterized protein (DUF1800 family)